MLLYAAAYNTARICDPQMQLYHIAGATTEHTGDLLFYGEDSFIRKVNRTVVVQSLTNPYDQTILRGHSSAVSHLSLHGDYLLSCESGYDSDVLLWDLRTQQIVQRFSEHDGGVVCAAFSNDGLFYVTCGKNGQMFIIETESGDIVTLGETEPLVALTFGSRVLDARGRRLALWHLLGVTEQGTLQHLIFDPKNAKLHQTVINTQNQRKQIIDVCFARNDSSLALAVCTSGEVLVVDLTTEEVLTRVQLPSSLGQCTSIACLTAPPEQPMQRSIYATYERAEALDELIVVGGSEFVSVLRGQAYNWDICNVIRVAGECRALDGLKERFIAGTNYGYIMLFEPTDRAQAYYGADGSLNSMEFAVRTISDYNTGVVTDIAFIDAQIVAFSGVDRNIRIFDLSDCLPALVINTTVRGNFASPIYPTRLFYNDVYLLVGFNCGDLHIYDIENGELLSYISTADRAAITALYAAENIICTGGQQGDVRLWDIRGSKLLYAAHEHTAGVTQIYYNPEYTGITSFSADRYAISTVNGKRACEFMAEGPINAAAILAGGYAIAENRKIALLDLRRKQVLFSMLFEYKVTALATDGQATVFAGFDDGTIRVLSAAASGLEIRDEIAYAHSGAVTCVAFGGTEVATADSTGEIMFWAVAPLK